MSSIEVKVPDIGDFKDVPVIEILVKPGDVVQQEQSLLTLESDKATMDVPSPVAGTVGELRVKLGDKVAEGTVVLMLKVGAAGTASATTAATPPPQTTASAPQPLAASTTMAPVAASGAPPTATVGTQVTSPANAPAPAAIAAAAAPIDATAFVAAHASPAVRKVARELGVDLARVTGTGPRGRILQEDVQAYVKATLQGIASAAATAPPPASGGITGGALDLLPWPTIDFAKFGPVDVQPLSRIRKISGANLARNWVMIPHVTQFDEADVTDLEAFRVQVNKENEKAGIKLTMLAFLIAASVTALKRFPEFNASLDGGNLVLKRYFHIGFAADTPNGLVVPVLKNADRKGVLQIAREMAELSMKAREGKLGPADMQGGCFSISSLGGIGGTAFTPIINAPEVAILGVSKGVVKPVWNGREFVPRLMLPLSLSYDHRVIDGAAAARFTTHLGALLADMRRTLF